MILEGVALEHYAIPIVFLVLSFGIRQLGIPLSRLH
jgi:hypothetical protein